MKKKLEFNPLAVETAELIRTVQSIKKNGLCPLSKIPDKKCFVNPTLGVREVQELIAFNTVDTSLLEDDAKDWVLNTAFFEEYTGAAGIAIERRWPFHHAKVKNEEISRRLCSSLVFLMKSDKQIDSFHDSNTQAYLTQEISQPQVRGELLIETKDTNSKWAKEYSISELKLNHVFKSKEWLAVLVPEPLVKIVKSILSDGVNIIPVPLQKIKFKKLPAILELLHDERVNQSFDAFAPQYMMAAKKYLASRKIKEFYLHTVRLNTCFDFTYWYIDDLKKNGNLIQELQGEVVQKDGPSGWIRFHKSISTEIKKTTKDMREANLNNIACYEKLVSIKKIQSNSEKIYIFGNLPPKKMDLMIKVGVKVLSTHGYWVLAFPEALKANVKEIIDKPLEQIETEEKSIQLLQLAIRASQACSMFSEMAHNKAQIKTLETANTTLADQISKLGL